VKRDAISRPLEFPSPLSVGPASNGLSGLGGAADPASRHREVFYFLFSVFPMPLFGMVKWGRHPEVRIRSSPPYPRSGGASSAGGFVESCVCHVFAHERRFHEGTIRST
jgi:hypothetical protein